MTWWEALIAIPVISITGAVSAALTYRHMEQTKGKIVRTEEDLEAEKFCHQMRALGLDPTAVMHATSHAVAVGIEPWQLRVLAHLFAKGEVKLDERR